MALLFAHPIGLLWPANLSNYAQTTMNHFSGKILLIDACNLIHRVYAGAQLENAPESIDTLVDITSRSIKRALKENQPSHAVAVFEGQGQTWRHKLLPNFKENRPKKHQAFIDALPLIKNDLLETFNIRSVEIEHYEADDVIATFATSLSKRQIPCTILSTDKDFSQIVNLYIKLRNHFSREDRDETWVHSKFNVYPKQIRTLFALVGDKNDKGIPGVPGIGVKTAAKLIRQYGDFQNLIDHAEKIGGKVGENLQNYILDFILSYKLMELKTNIDLSDFNLHDFRI